MAALATYNTTDGCKNVVPIRPSVQRYAWGIRGLDSRVARYALESGIVDEVDPDQPYAEMWIGTHPKAPSMLLDGSTLESAVGSTLPFLFKVLSCGKTLSIQAHPDKRLAEKLHIQDPTNYGDANHKPEMAIALTPFEAMCGFRRLGEIRALLRRHPEFAACISDEAKLAIFMSGFDEQSKSKALQKMFGSFMSCDPDVSTLQLSRLLERLQREQSTNHPHPHQEPRGSASVHVPFSV